jgi:hypothetical protein
MTEEECALSSAMRVLCRATSRSDLPIQSTTLLRSNLARVPEARGRLVFGGGRGGLV